MYIDLSSGGIACSIWTGAAKSLHQCKMQAILLIGMFLLSVSCFAGKLPEGLDGYYSMPSDFCAQYKGKKRAQCHKSMPDDCLLVKQLSPDTLHIEVHNSQPASVCWASGTARIENGQIIYRQLNERDQEMAFRLEVSKRFLTVKVLSAPINDMAPFCGVHGDLDGHRFLRSRKSRKVQKCEAG